MLSCNQVKYLHDYPVSYDCFSDVEIKGGICYYLIDKGYNGKCSFSRHDGNLIQTTERFLKEARCNVLIRFDALIDIFRKVLQVEGENYLSFSNIVSGRSPFGLNTNHHGNANPFNGGTLYLESSGYKYIATSRINRNLSAVSKYKVYISKAYGAGEGWPHQIINRPILGTPGTCCSGTYLLVGPFETKVEAENVITYMNTKFFRMLVSINKISQDAYAKVYADVPLQDFSRPWTDEDLYAKYNLTADEIAFIEATIKPME